MNHRVYLYLLAPLFISTLIARPASAQTIGHRLKLGMEAGFFEFATATVTLDGSDQEETTKLTTFGFAPADLDIDFGYGAGDQVVVGARLGLESRTLSVENRSDSTTFGLSLIPHVDYVFLPVKKLRPFLGAQVGLQYESINNDEEIATLVYLFGVEAGLAIFVTESLSLDPRLSFLYGIGSAKVSGIKADANALMFDVMLGLTGWI